EYPGPGAPKLANKIFNLLGSAGIDAQFDDQRGFDHGLFVPLKLMYPEANIPCVQLSLVNNLQPEQYIRMGKALADLRKDNVLVMGSGFSFHNLKAFFAPSTQQPQAMNQAFEHWLIDTCSNRQMTEEEREHRLINWESAPAARYCHPREEHLLPHMFAMAPPAQQQKEYSNLKSWGKWRVLIVGKTILFKTNYKTSCWRGRY
ncbi:MAG: DODA-type extradiol aromatic ring-opening family dioxygenase, partial [Methylobacter sp.]